MAEEHPTCKSCIHQMQGAEGTNRCTRFPPQLHIILTVDQFTNEPEMKQISAFPPVGDDMWCGEYWGIESESKHPPPIYRN